MGDIKVIQHFGYHWLAVEFRGRLLLLNKLGAVGACVPFGRRFY